MKENKTLEKVIETTIFIPQATTFLVYLYGYAKLAENLLEKHPKEFGPILPIYIASSIALWIGINRTFNKIEDFAYNKLFPQARNFS